MKTKLIALLSFIMILSLTVVACNKNNKTSEVTSEKVSITQSIEESETESHYYESESTSSFESIEESASQSEHVSESQSEATSSEESETESETATESETTSESESESETESETATESETTSESESETESESESIVRPIEECQVRLIIKDYDGNVIIDSTLTGAINLTVEEWIIEKFDALNLIYGRVDTMHLNGVVASGYEKINENSTIEIVLLNNETVDITLIIKDYDGSVIFDRTLTGTSGLNVDNWLIDMFDVQHIIYGKIDTLAYNGELVNTSAEVYADGTIEITLIYSETINVRLVIEDYDGGILFDYIVTGDRGLTLEAWVIEKFDALDLIYGKLDTVHFNGMIADFSEQINVGGTIEIVLLNNETVEINLIIIDHEGNVLFDRSLTGESGLNVESWLIDKFGVQDIIYGKIDTLAYNGELVNTSAEVYADGTIEIHLINPEDAVVVTVVIAYPDGQQSLPEDMTMQKGISAVDMVLIIAGGDYSALQMIGDVLVNGESIGMDWILTENCEVTIVISNMPPFGGCYVSLVGEDTDGNKMYDMQQMVEQGTSVYDALIYNFGLYQEDLDRIISFTINGEAIDIYNTYIYEDCIINVVVNNIIGGDVQYMPIRIEICQGENVEIQYITMYFESMQLEEIIKIIFGCTYEEMAKEGIFHLGYEEELYADAIIYAGQTLYYVVDGVTEDYITINFNGEDIRVANGTAIYDILAEVDPGSYRILVNGEQVVGDYVLCDGDYVIFELIGGDMGGYNVWFDVDENGVMDGMDQFFVPMGTTLESLINEYASSWWNLSYDEAISYGYFTVNGYEVDRYYVLSPEDYVVFVRNEIGGGCNHNFDPNGYCPDCGYQCPHDTYWGNCGICGIAITRSIQIWIYAMYAYEHEDGGVSYDYRGGWTYKDVHYTETWTIRDAIIYQFGEGFEEYEGVARVWYKNGEIADDYDEVKNGDVIIGVPEGTQFTPFTISVEVEELGSKEYTYDLPVVMEWVHAQIESDFNIQPNVYERHVYNEYGDSTSFDLIFQNATIEYRFEEVYVNFKAIDENSVGQEQTFKYRVDKKPTLVEFLEANGISAREYYIYNDSSRIYDVEICGLDYYNVTAIKKSVVAEEFTVNVTCYDEYGTEFKGSAVFTEPVTLVTLWEMEIEMQDGGYFYIGWRRENIYTVNGVNHTFIYGDPSYVFVYGDAELVVKRGYYVYVDTEDEYMEFIFEEKPTGADILEALEACGLEIDADKYLFECDGFGYDGETFIYNTFPLNGYACYVRIQRGSVFLSYYYEDSLGGWYDGNTESRGEVVLSEIISEEVFNSCDWEIYVRCGYQEDVYLCNWTDYGCILTFEKQYSDEFGRVSYHLKGSAKEYTVSLYIDEEWVGEMTFAKADNLTLGDVLAQFGNYSYGNYMWNFHGDYDYLDENTVMTGRIELYGNDLRPRFTLYVNGEGYELRHTSDMTLREVIDVVNEEYDVAISFDDYIWDEHITLDYVVANEGYWGEVYARTLTEIDVMFYSLNGPVNFSDSGVNGRSYAIDDEWETPTEFYDLEMYYGAVYPTGRWEYHETVDGEDVVTVISSVEDLFALKKQYVELVAEFEIDAQINGVYAFNEKRVLIISGNLWSLYDPYHDEYLFYNEQYEVGFGGDVYLHSERFGISIPELMGEAKIGDNEVVIFVKDGYNAIRMLYSYEEYYSFVEGYEVLSIKNVHGDEVALGSYGRIYIVTVAEMA